MILFAVYPYETEFTYKDSKKDYVCLKLGDQGWGSGYRGVVLELSTFILAELATKNYKPLHKNKVAGQQNGKKSERYRGKAELIFTAQDQIS